MTRFPTYPTDILSRADALLASKYGTSEPIDPALAAALCDKLMELGEIDAKLCESIVDEWYRPSDGAGLSLAKAIRGTE